jgi:hypothetical protein
MNVLKGMETEQQQHQDLYINSLTIPQLQKRHRTTKQQLYNVQARQKQLENHHSNISRWTSTAATAHRQSRAIQPPKQQPYNHHNSSHETTTKEATAKPTWQQQPPPQKQQRNRHTSIRTINTASSRRTKTAAIAQST